MKILMIWVLLLGVFQTHAFADQDLELIEQFAAENFGFGDDGVDCPISTSGHAVLSENRDSTSMWHRLLSFQAEQGLRPHGCGARFNCYALIRSSTRAGKGELVWGNCNF